MGQRKGVMAVTSQGVCMSSVHYLLQVEESLK